LLILTNKSTLRTATPQRICLGAVIGALGFMIPILGFANPVIGMSAGLMAGVAGMLVFTFRVRRWKNLFRLLEHMLIYSFCMGGGLLFLRNLSSMWRGVIDNAIGMAAISGVLFGVLYGIQNIKNNGNSICIATLKTGSSIQRVTGLVDSGNSLVEPISGKGVCVIDKELFESLWQENPPGFRVIPYHSVGCKAGIMPGYLLEELEIEYEGMSISFQKVYVAVSGEIISSECKGHSIKIIINPGLFREKQKGRP